MEPERCDRPGHTVMVSNCGFPLNLERGLLTIKHPTSGTIYIVSLETGLSRTLNTAKRQFKSYLFK